MVPKALTAGQKLSLRVLTYYATLDESHLNYVFAKTHNTLMRSLHKTCHITDYHEQMDLVQDIQIKALACFRKQLFQVLDAARPSSLYTYLSRIMISVVIDVKRRDKLKTVGSSLDPETWDYLVASVQDNAIAPDNIATTEAERMIQTVTGLVNALAPKYRDVMLAVRYQGLSYLEAAAALNLNIGTLKLRVHTARNLLLQQVKALGIAYPTADVYAALHHVDNGELFGTGKGHDRVNAGFHRDKKSFKDQINTNNRKATQLLGRTREPAPYPMPAIRA